MKSLYWKGEIIMKRNIKMLLSFIMVIAMVVTMSVGAFAATADNVQQYETYTFIGDSIAAGHSLDDYYSYGAYGDGHLIKDSYAQIVNDAVGATDVRCDAMQGMNTVALRYLLDDTYEMDAITSMLVPMLTSYRYTADSYAGMRDQFTTDIADSDLITIGIGSNDLMYATMIDLFKLVGRDLGIGNYPTERECLTKLIEMANEYGTVGEVFAQLLTYVQQADKMAQFLKIVVEDITNAQNTYTENIGVIMDKIHALNPDATVVFVGLYNPVRDMGISEDIDLSVGHVADTLIINWNTITKCTLAAKNYSNFKFASVWDTEVYECFNISDALSFSSDFFSAISHCVHPTVNGHAYIANQILKVLPGTDSSSIFSSLCG